MMRGNTAIVSRFRSQFDYLILRQLTGEKRYFLALIVLFVCVEVLQPSQQLRSCRAGQLPINTVPGQA